jgi:hypothetical protein
MQQNLMKEKDWSLAADWCTDQDIPPGTICAAHRF